MAMPDHNVHTVQTLADRSRAPTHRCHGLRLTGVTTPSHTTRSKLATTDNIATSIALAPRAHARPTRGLSIKYRTLQPRVTTPRQTALVARGEDCPSGESRSNASPEVRVLRSCERVSQYGGCKGGRHLPYVALERLLHRVLPH